MKSTGKRSEIRQLCNLGLDELLLARLVAEKASSMLGGEYAVAVHDNYSNRLVDTVASIADPWSFFADRQHVEAMWPSPDGDAFGLKGAYFGGRPVISGTLCTSQTRQQLSVIGTIGRKFGAVQIQVFHSVLRQLSHSGARKGRILASGNHKQIGTSGIAVVDGAGTIQQSTDEALELLNQASGGAGIRSRPRVIAAIPDSLWTELRKLRSSSISRDTLQGRITITSHEMNDSTSKSLTGLVITKSWPEALLRLNALVALGVASRQREVALAIVAGCSAATSAAALGLSVNTVGHYRTRLFERLHVHSKEELITVLDEVAKSQEEAVTNGNVRITQPSSALPSARLMIA